MAIKVINETSLSETVVIFYSTVYDHIDNPGPEFSPGKAMMARGF